MAHECVSKEDDAICCWNWLLTPPPLSNIGKKQLPHTEKKDCERWKSLFLFTYSRSIVSASRFPANRLFGTAIFLSSCLNLLIPAATVFDPKAVIIVRVLQVRTVNSHSMAARNQVGIGMSYRHASICSLATKFQTRFLKSTPRGT